MNIGQVPLSSVGNCDVFIAKYDTYGNPIWAKQAGGSGTDAPFAIAADAAGNFFVTGTYQGEATFGSFVVPGHQSFDVFLAKYNTEGECKWVAHAGGIGRAQG